MRGLPCAGTDIALKHASEAPRQSDAAIDMHLQKHILEG